MKRIPTLLFALLLSTCLGFTFLSAQSSSWSTDGTKVQLNGKNFLFKGVNYAPVPYGASPEYTLPHGSYFIPKARVIWERDIALMRAMGTNSIRLYAGVNETIGGLDLGNYQAFLDALYNNGNDPIYVFLYNFHGVGAESKDSANFNATKSGLLSLITRWKDHPAVAGIVIGNETEGDNSTFGKAAYWQGIGEICDAIKAVAPNKLTINAMIDDGSGVDNTSPKVQAAYANRQYLDNLDIIGINCYRGPDLGTEAKVQDPSVSSNSVFLGYSRSWTTDRKPLVITEFGVSWGTGGSNVREADSSAQVQKGENYIRKNWTVINNNYKGQDGDPSVVAGGFVFSWVDEWYKIYINGAATPTVHNANNGQTANSAPIFPGGQNDEEWFGVMRLDQSKLNPKTVTWDINNLKADPLVKRGTYGVLQSLWKIAKKSAFTAQATSAIVSNGNGAYDSWFGVVYEDSFPWVYQQEHDWVYVEPGVSDEDGKAWIWDQTFDEWFWVNEDSYPWMYRGSDGVWIYYFEGTDNPEFYWDSSTGTFFTHWENLLSE